MKGVGLPGGKHHRYVGGAARARQAEYRHSEKGRLARKMYLNRQANPEAWLKRKLRRDAKLHAKGLR